MDWEQLREKTLGEVGTSLVSEGAGVTGGFLLAGFVGRQIQDRVKSDDAVTASPTATNKVMAWTANNVPKLALWYLLKKYAVVEPGETLTPMKEATVDAKKAVAGSIVFDTLVRLSQGGINPARVDLFGYRLLGAEPQKSSAQSSSQADIQRLIQENSALRAELNKALQRLAQPPLPAPAPPVQQPMPVAPQVAAPPPVQMAPVQMAPMVQAQHPQVFQQAPPPVIRYQPAPPVISYTPVQQPAPVGAAAPIVRVEQRPPSVRAEEITPVPYSPGQPFAPYAAQPIPPAVQERQRKYGFMDSVTPPVVQERQKKYGFMAGEEKDVASMFGML
jgi:hypothetical protein